MYFDRSDICGACYQFLLNVTGNPTWSELTLEQKAVINGEIIRMDKVLRRLRYKPGLSDENLATLSSNAKSIYMILIRKYLGVHSTAKKEVLTESN